MNLLGSTGSLDSFPLLAYPFASSDWLSGATACSSPRVVVAMSDGKDLFLASSMSVCMAERVPFKLELASALRQMLLIVMALFPFGACC